MNSNTTTMNTSKNNSKMESHLNRSISDLSASSQGSADSNVSAARKLRRMKRKLLLDFVNDDPTNNDTNDYNDNDDDDASTVVMSNEREVLSLFSWSADNNPRLASQH
ncbi:unnamed protein product [Cylindrotheca closterium]|uniref:Uncharacterized protein n=1 Tax=Cylindrotheca closterium TaxID=2856 RepID=A0AAD2CTP9_9STRA|nr:unnamed protein product [Cylindrotheca closterium]